MNNTLIKRFYMILVLVARIAIGIIFVYASIDKIMNPQAFSEIVANYQMLPYALVNIFSIVMPWIELIAGILLIAGFRTKSSVIIISMLTIVFIIALMYNMNRGLDISCGCFTTDTTAKSDIRSLVIRDFVLLFFLILLMVQRTYLGALDNMLKCSNRKSEHTEVQLK